MTDQSRTSFGARPYSEDRRQRFATANPSCGGSEVSGGQALEV